MSIWDSERAELDRAVAIVEGFRHFGAVGVHTKNAEGKPWCLSERNDWWKDPTGAWVCGDCYGVPYRYSSDPALAFELMEKHGVECRKVSETWWAAFCTKASPQHHKGPTLAMAVCRAVAAIPNADGKTSADAF